MKEFIQSTQSTSLSNSDYPKNMSYDHLNFVLIDFTLCKDKGEDCYCPHTLVWYLDQKSNK